MYLWKTQMRQENWYNKEDIYGESRNKEPYMGQLAAMYPWNQNQA